MERRANDDVKGCFGDDVSICFCVSQDCKQQRLLLLSSYWHSSQVLRAVETCRGADVHLNHEISIWQVNMPAEGGERRANMHVTQ